ERIRNTLTFIGDCRFPDESRVWKKVDFFTVFIELDRLLVRTKLPALRPEVVRDRLEAFFTRVSQTRVEESDPDSAEAQYYHAVLQASNDRGNRVRRGKIIEALLT